MRHFLVTHKYNGQRWRAKEPSANRVRRNLPRFNKDGGYKSYFDLTEIDEATYRRLEDLPDYSQAET